MSKPDDPRELAEHFFRHQSGQLIATLTRVLGPMSWELVEDVVQNAFVQALRTWPSRGIPADPAGWLFRVARNQALDQLRRSKLAQSKQPALGREELHTDQQLEQIERAEILEDDQLRLLALCCHPELPAESQIALALKLVAGFNSVEIARGLLTTEENIHKRLTRAKQRLREEPVPELSPEQLPHRLPLMLNVVYLLFNEGYNAANSERVLRQDLCEEALRLGLLLARHPRCQSPASSALVALMCFHASRFPARETETGELILLEKQDRTKWDQTLINQGLRWLWASGRGAELSTFHLEAGIAAEYGLAESFSQINWLRVLALYNQLVQLQPTVINCLNRAIAVAYAHGPLAGLNALAQVDPKELPPNYTHWDVAHGELYRRLGNFEAARLHFRNALAKSSSPPERALLTTRLAEASPP